ncbi:hypothetical protein [Candidatus Thiodictyon syntrophicum]|jgi:hypothetical protein|uniref:hypothetical protein n=1 Tax=Candidatus Thiodictyon syntrophicum TaxID=1166950 RepID=UPI0012FE73D8|nr:hypothetical protein [Candidatus Thiodictyon syntrophicum]
MQETREPEPAALRAIEQGATLGEALEQGLDADPDFDPAQALPRWLGAGAVASVPNSQPHREIPHECDGSSLGSSAWGLPAWPVPRVILSCRSVASDDG